MPFLNGKIIKPSVKFYQTIIKGQHGLQEPRIGKANKFLKSNGFKFTQNLIKSRIYVSDEFSDYNQFWAKGEKLKFEFLREFDKEVLVLSLAKIIFEHQIESAKNVFEHLEEFKKSGKEGFMNHFEELIEENMSLITALNDILKPIMKNI